jgi:hypothetical protein
MLAIKRDTFTHLCNKLEGHGPLGFVRNRTLILILLIVSVNLSCEKPKSVGPGSTTKANSPPVITSVSILPENPNKENELSLVIQGNDPDGDPITFHYQWIKNDGDMIGENKNTLKPENLGKGDVIQVKVTPSDGKESGKPFLSPAVKILNSAPVIQELSIEPKMPSVRDDLKVSMKSFDADGDSIYFAYQWEKNGVVLMDERKEILERGRFRKGDSFTLTVIPDDREILGTPKKSEAVTILNSPPTIVSSPPTSIEGTKYLYQVKATDPDNDPIAFDLKSGPKGMKIDQKTGLIQWEIQKEDKGTHSIEIEVSDNEGAKSHQQFTLVIEVK